jgi:hypothetical protein
MESRGSLERILPAQRIARLKRHVHRLRAMRAQAFRRRIVLEIVCVVAISLSVAVGSFFVMYLFDHRRMFHPAVYYVAFLMVALVVWGTRRMHRSFTFGLVASTGGFLFGRSFPEEQLREMLEDERLWNKDQRFERAISQRLATITTLEARP